VINIYVDYDVKQGKQFSCG